MFTDRAQAGYLLADKLKEYKENLSTVVLSIPRGGVVVGSIISKLLKLPQKIIIVKKLIAPNNQELAIGAVTSNEGKPQSYTSSYTFNYSNKYLRGEIKDKMKILREAKKKFRKNIADEKIKKYDRYILVDDGVATGSTIYAAIETIKSICKFDFKKDEKEIIIAVPVISVEVYNDMRKDNGMIIALEVSDKFRSVSQFYKYFMQVTDSEVLTLLKENI